MIKSNKCSIPDCPNTALYHKRDIKTCNKHKHLLNVIKPNEDDMLKYSNFKLDPRMGDKHGR